MMPSWKVVVLGEARVGKTSLINRLCFGTFAEHEQKTLNATSFTKDLTLEDTHQPAKVAVWDTAGQEKFHALNKSYYQDALGAAVVFDLTDACSYDKMKSWVKELGTVCPGVPVVILGNKADMSTSRQVDSDQCVKYNFASPPVGMQKRWKASTSRPPPGLARTLSTPSSFSPPVPLRSTNRSHQEENRSQAREGAERDRD